MSRLRRLLAALVLSLAAAGPAAGQSAPDGAEAPAVVTADQISYDEELGVVVASGNVEIAQAGRILLADTVTYNQRTDEVTASGNVSLMEPTGEVLFAEYVQLTDQMRNGFIRNLGILLQDNSRLAAVAGQRTGGTRTEMRKAVYSPCDLCSEDPTAPPVWQVKAREVVHDSETKDIVYRDAWLEMFGVPTFYTPYLSHPDPTVKRRSGLLTPSFGNDSQFGYFTRLPYFIVLDDDKDLTLEPILMSDERPALVAEYRHRLSDGEFESSGSFTRVEARDQNGERIDGKEVNRGHLFGFGRFDIDRTWRWGYDAAYASDDTYLRRYRISSVDSLVTSPFLEGFRSRNYAEARAYHFQGLREHDDPNQTPFILPVLNYNHVGEPDSVGGRWKTDVNFLNLTRLDGTDSRRLSLKLGWEAPFVNSIGQVFTLTGSLQTDGYWVEDVIPENDTSGRTLSGLTGRSFPQAKFEMRWPLVRQGKSFRQMLEPMAAVVAGPNFGNPEKIPNEDSRDFEFDETNLFSLNRFPGLDRVNPGQRAVYGLSGGVYGDSGGSSTFFLGQSYRLRPDDTFPEGSGLRDKLSDIVGKVQATPGEYFDLLYRFRLSRTDLGPVRNEIRATAGPKALRLSVGYFSFEQQQVNSEFPDREEIAVGLAAQVTERWSVSAAHRRDLTVGGGPLFTRIGAGYADECLTFNVDFTRSEFRDRDIQPSDSVMFRVVFKHLGEVRQAVQ